jgi:hypothetical protein
MVNRQNKKQSPKMAQNADFVRVSARLSSANQYQLIETYEMFCYKGHSSKKFITKDPPCSISDLTEKIENEFKNKFLKFVF